MIQLTKTDFIQFLDCPKSLWLSKRDPEKYPKSEFSAFMQKLIKEGYEVERYARDLFANLDAGRSVEFQKIFRSETSVFAKADIVVTDALSRISIFEVKSNTSLKNERGKKHLKDACFQWICAQDAGYDVASVAIVHLNKDYVRCGAIDARQFLECVDVTVQAKAIAAETRQQIEQALSLLAQSDIDRKGCDCKLKSRANHCDSFAYFNQDVPEYSTYCLPRLSHKKRQKLLQTGVIALEDIPDTFDLSPQQKAVQQATKTKLAQIHKGKIAAFHNKLSYPIYFLDFETYCSAVPFIDGVKPHQQIPVQYSLHRQQIEGEIFHYEYLADSQMLPLDLILSMKEHIGSAGSIVSWCDSFEKTRNKEMALMYPDHAKFLKDINRRMVNLEDVFKCSYVDMRFDGSTSIKKVLPVVCPHLSYNTLAIKDGTGAMEAWATLTGPECSMQKKKEIKLQLLEYCKLDTFAMIEILKFIKTLVD